MGTPLDEFHNRLRIMLGIESEELIDAGAGVDPDTGRIRGDFIDRFMADPYREFIRADDRTAKAIWSIIEARSSKRAA